jgi:hypothetical protein
MLSVIFEIHPKDDKRDSIWDSLAPHESTKTSKSRKPGKAVLACVWTRITDAFHES